MHRASGFQRKIDRVSVDGKIDKINFEHFEPPKKDKKLVSLSFAVVNPKSIERDRILNSMK